MARKITPHLNTSLSTANADVSKIKSNPLKSGLFKRLCSKNDEEFQKFLLQTEVRWLSQGNCLTRLFSFFNTVIEFIQSVNSFLAKELGTIMPHVAYLADNFAELCNMSLPLQSDEINLIKSKSFIHVLIWLYGFQSFSESLRAEYLII